MESYEYKKPYEKSLHRDHRRGLRPLGRKTQSGLELDQFCMAENLDQPKYESCCKEIRRLFTDCKVSFRSTRCSTHRLTKGSWISMIFCRQAKELRKPDTTYTVEVIHYGKAMEWLENQKTL